MVENRKALHAAVYGVTKSRAWLETEQYQHSIMLTLQSLLTHFTIVGYFSSVQSFSCFWLFAAPWTAACQTSLSVTSYWSLLKLMSIESVMPSNNLILCRPLLCLLQSFPAWGSFPMSQFFTSGGQSIGVSASVSILPMNIQDLFPLGWTGWIFLQFKGLSRVFSNTTVESINSSVLSFPYSPTLAIIQNYWKKL